MGFVSLSAENLSTKGSIISTVNHKSIMNSINMYNYNNSN